MIIHIKILFQLNIQASDNRFPPRVTNNTISVNVQRDVIAPVFSSSSYDQFTISENIPRGNVIHNSVRATDEDLQGEIRYEIVGEMTAAVQFGIVEDVGNIIVISNLNVTEQNLFKVCYSIIVVFILYAYVKCLKILKQNNE